MRRSSGRELDGHLHPDFIPVAAAFQRQIDSYSGGGALCIYHRGECVLDLWGGERNEAGDAWQQDTMAPSFSTTKGVASTLIHIMVDRGLLTYEQRVADVWPEFAQAGKQDITLRQVLSHQSGLYHIRQMIDRADRMLDWDFMVRAIERSEPVHPPGDRTGYHGLTYGYLVGEILQRVTGTPFPELVQTELVEPLGLDGMYIGAPREALPRAAQLIWPKQMAWLSALPSPPWSEKLAELGQSANGVVRRGLGRVGLDLDFGSLLDALAPRGISTFDFGAPETLQAAIPAGNGLFTARSLARMYAALAGGGELDGTRLLSRATLDRAIVKQERAPGLAVLPFDMRWRLGYHGIATTRGFPSRAFGHFGFGGSGAWADPRRNLSIGLIVNCGMGTPFGDTRIPRLGGAALTCVRRRGRAHEADSPGSAPERVPVHETQGFASQAG